MGQPFTHLGGLLSWMHRYAGYLFNMTMLHTFFGVNPLDGVYWTLSYELIFYFLVAVIIAFKWFPHLVLFTAIWLLYCICVPPTQAQGAFSILFFPQYAPFFIGGMLLFLIQTKQAAAWKLYGLLGVAFMLSVRTALAGLVDIEANFHQPFSHKVVASIIGVFFAVFLLVINRKINLSGANWLTWAGALTYPIYLLHHNMGYVVFQRLGPHLNKYVLLAGMLCTLFVLAYLLHVLVERPYSKRLAKYLKQILARA